MRASVTNVTGAPVEAAVGMHLGGAATDSETVSAGRLRARSGFPSCVPAWSRGVVIDIAMDRAQWGRFTDFGVTLFDSLGQQLGKQPLNYAFGRLQVELPEGHGDVPVTLGLFPGFADPAGDQRWSAPRLDPAVRRLVGRAGPAPAVGIESPSRRMQSAHADFALPQRRPGRSAPSSSRSGCWWPGPTAGAGPARSSSRRRGTALAPVTRATAGPSASPRGRDSGATGSRRRCARCAAGRSTT